MTATEQRLVVVCDDLTLNAGACIPSEAKGVAVLLHGIPSVAPPDPGDPGYPGLARQFASEGWLAAWVDMRGVRGSPGYFSIEGWVRDATAALDAARALPGASDLPLALIGSSAGGAVAVEAIRRGAAVDALVLLAAPAAWLSFANGSEAALGRIRGDAGMPLAPHTLSNPGPWIAEFLAVTAEEAIGEVTAPVLIVHGTEDDVVPVAHAERLAARAPGAEVRIIENAPHHLRRHEEAMRIVLDWLDETLA